MAVTLQVVDSQYVFFDSDINVIETMLRWFDFMHKQENKNISPLTIKQYASVMLRFLNHLEKEFPDFPPDEAIKLVDRDIINKIYDTEKYKPATLMNTDSTISAFYKWFSTEIRDEDPDFINPYALGPIIRKKVHRSISKFLVAEEIIPLINALKNESEKVLLSFMYDTGLRISEVRRLKLKDMPSELIENAKYIRFTVPGSKGHGGSIKERQTFISKPVLSRIKQYHNSYEYRFTSKQWSSNDPEKPMFLSCNGKPIYRELVDTQIKRAVARTNLNKKVSPHWLRHSAAVSLMRSEFGDSFIDRMLLTMSCLGHESVKTTAEYTRLPFAIQTKVEEFIRTKYDEAKYIYENTVSISTDENRGHYQ